MEEIYRKLERDQLINLQEQITKTMDLGDDTIEELVLFIDNLIETLD